MHIDWTQMQLLHRQSRHQVLVGRAYLQLLYATIHNKPSSIQHRIDLSLKYSDLQWGRLAITDPRALGRGHAAGVSCSAQGRKGVVAAACGGARG